LSTRCAFQWRLRRLPSVSAPASAPVSNKAAVDGSGTADSGAL
jgi:hypothetical protein